MAKVVDTKVYVVAGTVDGRMEYLSFDSASGGYPYASASIQYKTHDLRQAVEWLKDATKNLPSLSNPKVYEISLCEVDVSEVFEDNNVVSNLLSQLTTEQKNILRNILK